VGPHLGYKLAAVDSGTDARPAAQAVEDNATAAAVGNLTDPERRATTVAALRASARAATEWGGPASAFPGLA